MTHPISTPLETQIFLAARSYLYGGASSWSHLEHDPYAPAPRRRPRAARRPGARLRGAFGRKGAGRGSRALQLTRLQA
jgi:hypothetical protein